MCAQCRSVFVVCLAILYPSAAARSAESISVDAVRAAWEARCSRIKSFIYSCTIDTGTVEATTPNQDPFNRDDDRSTQVDVQMLQQKITFAMSDGMFRYSEVGDKWDTGRRMRINGSFDAVFDGVSNRRLSTGGRLPLGQFDQGGGLGDAVAAHVNQTAIWLWYSPVTFLTKVGYNMKRIDIRNSKVDIDGVACVELAITRPRSKWLGLLYVDPSREFVPVRLIEQMNGVTLHDEAVAYQPTGEVGYAVASWKNQQFDEGGRSRYSKAGKVDHVSVNGTVEASLFHLDFPVGSHVLEKAADGKHFYIQTENGELKPIGKDEYGRPPKGSGAASVSPRTTRLPLIVTSGIVVVGCVLVVKKYIKITTGT